jgi:UDP-N-acetylglucosamine acyltransferase
MSSRIHPTAIIDPGAHLHETVEVGPYAIVGAEVSIGAGTWIGAHVVIQGRVILGQENKIFPGAVIGLDPQDYAYQGDASQVVIGDRNHLREYVTIHRATQGDAITQIGNDNLLMVQAHVGHNCQIEDRVTIANGVSLGGYAHIESRAVIGGMAGIHQFVRVGQLSMVGAMTRITRDVPPFMLVDGNPPRVRGLNKVGLQRNGVEDTAALKAAYRLLYFSTEPYRENLARLSQQNGAGSVAQLCHFLKESLQSNRRGAISAG